MTFNQYQKLAKKTARYPSVGENYVYPSMGLGGEAGEVLNKVKKVFRDKNGKLTKPAVRGISKELGDVLWYLSQIATELGKSLDSIARENICMLASRKRRGRIKGSGDNR